MLAQQWGVSHSFPQQRMLHGMHTLRCQRPLAHPSGTHIITPQLWPAQQYQQWLSSRSSKWPKCRRGVVAASQQPDDPDRGSGGPASSSSSSSSSSVPQQPQQLQQQAQQVPLQLLQQQGQEVTPQQLPLSPSGAAGAAAAAAAAAPLPVQQQTASPVQQQPKQATPKQQQQIATPKPQPTPSSSRSSSRSGSSSSSSKPRKQQQRKPFFLFAWLNAAVAVLRRMPRTLIAFLLGGAFSAFLLYSWALGSPLKRYHPYRFTMVFNEATKLDVGSPVRMKGVQIGNVVSTTLRASHVEAVAEVADSSNIIPQGSRVDINLLGIAADPWIDITPPPNAVVRKDHGPHHPSCAAEGLIVCNNGSIRGQLGGSTDFMMKFFLSQHDRTRVKSVDTVYHGKHV